MNVRRLYGLPAFGGIVILAGVATGLSLASPGIAQTDRGEPLGSTISAAIEAEGPMITDAERALIRERCGYLKGRWDGRSVMSRGGVLHCADGRQVDDPEVRAIVERIGERARARVQEVMSRPDIRRAMSGEIHAEVREHMRRFNEEERPRIAAAVAAARASADAVDVAAIRADARAGAVHRSLTDEERSRLQARVDEAMRRIGAIDFGRIEREIEESVERGLGEHRPHRRLD
jgi:hypothetical protein